MEFTEKLNKTKPLIHILAKRFSRATNIPYEEFVSALFEEFYEKYPKYSKDKGEFKKFAKVILTQRAKRVATRKERLFYANVVHIDGQVDEEGNQTFEFSDDTVNVEQTAISNIEKSPDKLPLIRALLEQADDFTIAVVNRKLENPNATNNSIATELGVDHKKVDRCLRRLARNYDQSRFGDISQYLAS